MGHKVNVIIFLIVFLLGVTVVSGHFITDYGSSNTVTGPDINELPEQPTGWDVLTNGVGFLAGLTSFGFGGANLPIIFAFITWTVEAIGAAVVILIIRGA